MRMGTTTTTDLSTLAEFGLQTPRPDARAAMPRGKPATW